VPSQRFITFKLAIVSLHRAAKRLRISRVAMSNGNEELLTPIA
jgi:hypothetical protein